MDQKNPINHIIVTKNNMVNAMMHLWWVFLHFMNGRYLADGFGGAKVFSYINWVLCGIHGLIMLAYLLLFFAELYVAPKGGATVTIREDKQDDDKNITPEE